VKIEEIQDSSSKPQPELTRNASVWNTKPSVPAEKSVSTIVTGVVEACVVVGSGVVVVVAFVVVVVGSGVVVVVVDVVLPMNQKRAKM
jgi:hypothetical protein